MKRLHVFWSGGIIGDFRQILLFVLLEERWEILLFLFFFGQTAKFVYQEVYLFSFVVVSTLGFACLAVVIIFSDKSDKQHANDKENAPFVVFAAQVLR